MNIQNILVIEDDPDIRKFFRNTKNFRISSQCLVWMNYQKKIN